MRAVIGSALATLLLLTIGIGALHTPAGKPALRWLAGGGCPIGEPLTPEAAEQARQAALRRYLDGDPADRREVLGLPLLVATRADVEAWASSRGAVCTAEAAHHSCEGPGSERATFGFDPDGRLVSADVGYETDRPAQALARLEDREAAIRAQAGAPTASRGEATPGFLAAAPLRQVASRFEHENWLVSLTATHLGSGRYLVRETHQAL